MAEPKDSSGTASRNSWHSERRGLDRIVSGRHLDDQHHGHAYHHDTEAIDDPEDEGDITDDAELTEKDTEDSADSGEIVQELRDGILDERDLETGSKLGKSRTGKSNKSSRSARDPNLVTWDGPDDPENPKNWKMSRKWAATFVGKSALISAFRMGTHHIRQFPRSLSSRPSLLQWLHLLSMR